MARPTRVFRIREQHLQGGGAEHLAAHALAVAKKERYGHDCRLRDSTRTLVAYVNNGNWLADCRCRIGEGAAGEGTISGVAVDPSGEFDVTLRALDDSAGLVTVKAVCFGCGRRFSKLEVPDNWQALEQELMRRPLPGDRDWLPGESIAHLRRENTAHGIPEGGD